MFTTFGNRILYNINMIDVNDNFLNIRCSRRGANPLRGCVTKIKNQPIFPKRMAESFCTTMIDFYIINKIKSGPYKRYRPNGLLYFTGIYINNYNYTILKLWNRHGRLLDFDVDFNSTNRVRLMCGM